MYIHTLAIEADYKHDVVSVHLASGICGTLYMYMYVGMSLAYHDTSICIHVDYRGGTLVTYMYMYMYM